MLADDDFSIGMEIEEMLTALGYDVLGQAGSGRQAVEMARDLKPDIILMDIVMPGEMNGIEAAEIIKAESNLPIVFVSGYGDADLIEEAKRIAPFGYVMKPFDEAEIRASVEIALYKKSMDLKLEDAYDQVRRNEEMLTAAIHKSPIPIIVGALDGSILTFNEALVSLIGYKQEEIKNLEELAVRLGPDEKCRAVLREEIFYTLRGQQQYFKEIEITAKDGVAVSVQFHAAHFESGVIFQLIDITARKRAEEALKNSKRQLTQIIDFLPDPTFVIDNEGKVVVWNHAIERMTGIKAEKMLGKGNYEYAIPGYGKRRPILIDLVRNWDEETAKKYRYVKKEGECLVSETYGSLVRPGGVLWNKASLLYDGNGEVVGAIESIRDITEKKIVEESLKKSVKKYRSLESNIPAVIWTSAYDGKTIYISPNVETIFGYTQEEIYRNGPAIFPGRVHPEDTEKVAMAFRKLFEDGTLYDIEYRFRRKDGEWVRVKDMSSKVYERDGDMRVDGLVMIIADHKCA